MRAWVRDNYPGTKLGITEYNLGLGVTSDQRLQNVIEADALGIFGREGLDLATFWPDGSSPVPSAAFRIFRNYDGKHHGFGDLGVSATSSDQRRVSVYAARAGEDGTAAPIVVVNKASTALRTAVRLKHAARGTQGEGVAVRRLRHPQARRRPGPPSRRPAHPPGDVDHPDPGTAALVTRAVDLVVTGRVQGVSFRWYAAREATRLGLAGWIRNAPDGSVRPTPRATKPPSPGWCPGAGRAHRRPASTTWRSPRWRRREPRRSTSPTEPLRRSGTSIRMAMTAHRRVARSDHPQRSSVSAPQGCSHCHSGGY